MGRKNSTSRIGCHGHAGGTRPVQTRHTPKDLSAHESEERGRGESVGLYAVSPVWGMRAAVVWKKKKINPEGEGKARGAREGRARCWIQLMLPPSRYLLCHFLSSIIASATSAISGHFRAPFCLTVALLMDNFYMVAVLPKCTGAVCNSNVTAQVCGPWRR